MRFTQLPFFKTGCLNRFKVESGDLYEVVGGKPTVNLNGFDKYAVHFLRLRNPERGKPELNKIWNKFQDNKDYIIHNALSDSR